MLEVLPRAHSSRRKIGDEVTRVPYSGSNITFTNTLYSEDLLVPYSELFSDY